MMKQVWTLTVKYPDSPHIHVTAHENERECLLRLRDEFDPHREFPDVPESPEVYERWTEHFATAFDLTVVVDKHDVELAPDAFVIARFETPNFAFEGVGSDELMADLALKLAWKRHCDGDPVLDPSYNGYLEECWDDVNHIVYTVGRPYRDGEELA